MTVRIKDNMDGTATIVARYDSGRYVYDKDVKTEDLDSECRFLAILIAGGAA